MTFLPAVAPSSNLTRALSLANVIADERYQLYVEFVTEKENKIQEYLVQVRQASLASLGAGGNALAC